MQITLNDHTDKSRGTINHPSCLTWFPLLIPWSKQNIHLWHIWVWYYGYEIWLCFWECWTKPIWCTVISWAFQDDEAPGWQLGILKNNTKWVGYSILYPILINVGAILPMLTVKKSVFKSYLRTRPSIFLKIAVLCQMQAGDQGAFLHVFVKFPVLQMSGNFVSIWKSQIWAFF